MQMPSKRRVQWSKRRKRGELLLAGEEEALALAESLMRGLWLRQQATVRLNNELEGEEPVLKQC